MGSVNLFAAFAVMVFLVHNAQTVSATCSMDSDCLNGGTCDAMLSTCNCTSDFTGLNCENENCDIDAIPFSNQTTADSLDHDTSIVIACNIGYSTGIDVLTELMCDNGTLSAPPPVCYENCDILEIPFSNHTTNDTLEHDASIAVACNMGYSTGIGTVTELTCDNGTLTEAPTCYENCDILDIPFSNHTINDMLDHDASITVACNMGYSTGMGILTELMCNDGILSSPPPVCYENCDVDGILFSNHTMNDELDHDASIVVACDTGFSTGMGMLTELMCDNGTLSASLPICYENCDIDGIPLSNHTMNDELDHDASIVIACDTGFSTGMGILTELMCDNGTLSASLPICYENCDIDGIPFSNHTMNDELDHDASITVLCDTGFSTGMGTLTELMCDNGTLSASLPICYENCDIDGIPFSNQTIDDTILEHDASIVVACDTGYSTGTDTLTTELMCDNGTLSASLPICYENCDLDAVPNSNQTTNVTVEHDATVVVACDSGYTSESDITTTELTCDNGNFSPSPPTCSAICTVDSDCLNGGTCNAMDSTCNCTSDFTGLNCETENCVLEAVPNTNQTTNVIVEHDATVTVACDSGYTSESGITTELTCDNGTFSSSPPTCSAICTVDSDCLNGGTCDMLSTCNCTSDFTGLNCENENCDIEAVPNSNQTMNVTVEHDATVVVACDSGYTSESGITTELTCDNGTFSSSPPTCSAEEQQNATATTMEEETTATTSDAVQQNTTTTDTVQQNTTSTTPMQENTTATSTPQDTASTTPMQENATPTSTPQNTTSTTPMQDNTTPTSTQQNTTSLTPMQDNTTPTSTPQNTTSTAPMQDNTTVTSTPQNTASTTPMQDNTAATSTPQNTTSTTPIQENTTATSTPQSTTDQQNTTTQNTTTTADTTTGSPTTDVSQETTSEGGTTSEAATTGDTVPETTSVMTTTTPAATTVTTTTTPATTTELSTTATPDLDECLTGIHGCDTNALCINTVGSYRCECRNGFEGDGFSCYERIYIAYDPGFDDMRYYGRGLLAWYTIRLETGFPVGRSTLYSYITFTSTGMIHFSNYYPRSYHLTKYIHPSPFTFWDQFYFDPAIAVFGASVDLYRGNPSIYHQVYDINRSYGNSESQLSALKQRIYEALSLPSGINSQQFIEGINFFLKITWNRVQPPGSISGEETNTYQAVLFTDGRRSGILNMYQEGSFRWDPFSKPVPARIGWNIKSNRYNRYQGYRQTERIESYRPDIRIGNTRLQGRDIYRLDDNPDWYINARRYCQDWYDNDRSYWSWSWLAEPCPCTLWQARIDRRFTRCNYPYYGYGPDYDYRFGYNTGPPLYYYDRWGTTCYQPRWPRFGGGFRCTYYSYFWWSSSLIRGYRSLWRSSHYQAVMPSNARFFTFYYYSLNYYYAWIERDVLPRFYCCGQAGGRYCNLYERRRPRAHCWGYRPPRFGWFWGDPHINTIDGKKYTFNGLGEYTLMSYSHGDGFNLQSRTGKAFNGTEPVEHGTVFTGFAATQGITTVEFQLNDNRTEMNTLVNGSSINMTAFLEDGYDSLDETFILSSDTSDNETEPANETKVTALFQADGYPSTSFTVTFKNGILDIGVMVPPEYAENGTGRGLLGNVNGNKSDDFLLKNGTILTDPPGRNLTDSEIFQFGQTWQISEEESLFEYGDSDWSSYNPSNYTPIFLDELLDLDPVRTAAARAACQENEACLFDYLAVNPEMGEQTMSTGDQLDNDLLSLDNYPPNITDVTEITGTNALQDDDVLFVEVGMNVTLKISAEDPNEGDEVTFSFNSTILDGATISSDGIFTWIPPDLNATSIEIIAADNRNAQTSIAYKVLICECQNSGVCDFEDQAEGQDLNANGFAVVTCNCTDGWSGDHCDVDFNACEGSGPCYPGVICEDLTPSDDEEYNCGPCPSHLSGNGSNCFDFNECGDNNTNECDQICTNTLGSYTCSCNAGFVLSLDQKSCNEISDCDEALMNSTGSVNCTCDPGFELENGTCLDFDECGANVDECPSGISTCNNLPGDYNCTCLPGYENSSPKECQDIDECSTMSHDCNATNHFVCMNTQGSFACVCTENKFDIGGTCEDALTLSLGVGFTFISNFGIESYPEVIESEQTQNDLAQDVLEYLNASSSLSDDSLLAVSVQNYSLHGSYALVFFRVDLRDDTSLNSSGLEGIFMELLPDSRRIEPSHIVRPEDINECELSEDACRNGECTDTDGGFYCNCNEGFELGLGNDSCLEIDECASDPCQNGATCTDEINSYNCICAPGYNGTNCDTEDGSTTTESLVNLLTTTMGAETTTRVIPGEIFRSIVRMELTVSSVNDVAIEFTAELEDNTSPAFSDMEGVFCGETTNFLTSNLSSAENVTCVAVSFRSGSVIGDLEITLLATSQALADSLSDSVARLDLENANLGSLFVVSISVDNIDNCQSDTCRNGGTCTDGFNSFSCACATDYSGNDCSTYTGSGGLSTGAIVGIALGSVAGVLLIVVLIVCVVMAKKKKSGKEHKALVTGSRNRVSPMLRQSEEWQTEDQAMLAMEDRRYQGKGGSSEHAGVNNSAIEVEETKQ
ncbi:uncharacterized protein LOC129267997 isoform X2 [Lytechinus pictus]|uniref:uncharacterized protein LOC129267997 isoform X2 n=1 Tax=Lytechinus pictus TaxID=7653 RepID=UPI0030B9EDD9